MYFYNALELPGPIFRLHWDQAVLSVTYIETPTEKISAENRDSAKGYVAALVDRGTWTDLKIELSILQGRLDDYYQSNSVCLEDIEERFTQNLLKIGIPEKSYRFKFLTGEDCSFNKAYYGRKINLEIDEDFLVCTDKSSFMQKVVEKSQEKFLRYSNNMV